MRRRAIAHRLRAALRALRQRHLARKLASIDASIDALSEHIAADMAMMMALRQRRGQLASLVHRPAARDSALMGLDVQEIAP